MINQEAKEILKKYWGFDDFREGQLEVIQNLMEGNDGFVLFSTGGGKSLCYQIPALMKEGTALVVSPLISLMQDQVQQLKKKGISASFLHTDLSYSDEQMIYDNAKNGFLKLLYLSPEKLLSKEFLERTEMLNISLLAVDEAHCASQWGHDFRSSYLKIKEVRKLLPALPMVALTATATKKTRQETLEILGLDNNTRIFESSFERKNLTYEVLYTENKAEELCFQLKKHTGAGIVFVSRRKTAYQLSKYLSNKGFDADFYHAGLEDQERKKKLNDWLGSESKIMISTIAFGMGVDKSNLRKVIHYDNPLSIEAYYQEAGRAGRDGKKAHCVILYNNQDLKQNEDIFSSYLPTKKEFRKIIHHLYDEFLVADDELPKITFKIQPSEFAKKYKIEKRKLKNILYFLETSDYLKCQKPKTSSAKILVSTKNLDKNSESTSEKVLETLIRMYDGIFNAFVNIDEYRIAENLGIEKSKVSSALYQLHEMEVIEYKSNKDIQIVFTKTRRIEDVKILWKNYKSLQLAKWDRMQASFYFLRNTKDCRSKLIVNYFGQKGNKCGQCDNCKRNDAFSSKDLMNFLEKKPRNLQKILLHFQNLPREKVLEKLQDLINQEKIFLDEDDTFALWKD